MVLNLRKKIRERNETVRIVFCSTSNEFASDSYEVGATYYLQKPVTFESIERMVKSLNIEEYEKRRFVILPNGQKLVLRDFIYSEYSNHLISIKLKGNRTLKVWMSQANLAGLLSNYSFFVSINTGNIINLYEVSSFNELPTGQALNIFQMLPGRVNLPAGYPFPSLFACYSS